MYYIEKEVKLNTGVKYDDYQVHIITNLKIDYVNREISATLCSYKSLTDLAKNFIKKDSNVELCSNYFNSTYEMETFDLDPVLVAFRILIATEDSPFYQAEIRRMYDDSRFLNDLLPPESVENAENELQYDESWNDGVYEEYVDYQNELDREISKEFTISNVTVADVISE